MKINIFNNKKIEIDLPTFIDSRALICANSGGGKSYAVRKLLEEAHGKVMSIVLDIEGEFKTLREKFPDFLLIGDNGDVPLSMDSAGLLPMKLMELNVSTIVDISDLKRNERVKYVKIFLEALMELPRKGGYWKPCLIVLDEIHSLAGQQEKQDSCPSVIDLATRGRKRGYSLVGCTQRISKLHKDVVAELNNYMIGRTGLDIDMKRAAEILGFTNKLDMLSLRDLSPGEFYVFGPALTRNVTKSKIGEVITTHPKVGMDLREKIVQPTNEITKILSKLNDLPKEAKEELKTKQDLKRKINELKKDNRILQHSKPKPIADERALERARKIGEREALLASKDILNALQRNYNQSAKKLLDIGKILGKELPRIEIPQIKIDRPSIIPPIVKTIPRVRPIKETSTKHSYDGEEIKLGKCEKAIYSLLHMYPERVFTKPQMGVFTGYSYNSGSFSNAVSRLKILDLIYPNNGGFQLGEDEPELTEEFDFSKKAILSKLGKCEKEIYEVLLDFPETEFSKESLAEETTSQYSFASGSFSNAISRLNTFGLIQRENGIIKLNPELNEL